MEKIYDYTIKLLRYVLKGDVPDLPNDVDFEKLYEFGRSHGVENMLYVGLKDLKIDVPREVFQKFYYSYLMSIKIDTLQTMELEKIGKAFEEAGIDYIPLKGSVVKYFYPMPNYRKSGDIDVLIKREDEENARKVLTEQLGCSPFKASDRYEVHSAYVSKTHVHIELHRQILRTANRAYKTFKNVWKYAILSDGSEHKHRLPHELLYIHQLAHFCHHIYRGGAGIRMLMDFYVMKKSIDFDEDALKYWLKKSNLVEIDNYVNNTVDKWFGNSYSLDEDVETLVKIILSGGSFGTREMGEKIHDSTGLNGRFRQLFKRVFLPADSLVIVRPDYVDGKNSKFLMHSRRLKSILLHGRGKVFVEAKGILKNNGSDKNLKKIADAVCER